jgi:hypothetical protein
MILETYITHDGGNMDKLKELLWKLIKGNERYSDYTLNLYNETTFKELEKILNVPVLGFTTEPDIVHKTFSLKHSEITYNNKIIKFYSKYIVIRDDIGQTLHNVEYNGDKNDILDIIENHNSSKVIPIYYTSYNKMQEDIMKLQLMTL